MVIEVSKEVDVVRVGVDKYSLKTGLKIRSIMVISLRVLKEPRGFIRILQCIMAILAFATTAGFSTTCSFSHTCDTEPPREKDITYGFGYPFYFRDNWIHVDKSCTEEHDDHVLKLPFDFSSSSQFFVATGVVSFLYTILALIIYIFLHQQYTNDSKLPVIDLALTAIISVFWLAGSSAWAQGVTDLKYYLHPENLFGMLTTVCEHMDQDVKDCKTISVGQYATLNVSIIFGFGCFLLWLSSLWFVYKETVFHTPPPIAISEGGQNQTVKNDGRV